MSVPDEQVRRGGPGFSDSVTFAFGDVQSGLSAMARIGLSGAEALEASVIALMFAGSQPLAAVTDGPVKASGEPWAALEAGPLRATVEQPGALWTAAFARDGAGFELEFRALGHELASQPAGAGMQSSEQLCAVTGTVRTAGGQAAVACLGSRTRAWGSVDWERIESVRTVRAWISAQDAAALTAIRPAGAAGHEADAVGAALIEQGAALPLAEARLSTIYDEDGHHVRAGAELIPSDDESWPRRIAGDALAGATLELGRLRLEAAVYSWRAEGKAGLGTFELLRRA